MFKKIMTGIWLGGLFLWIYGCGSSGINIRTYAQDQPRVDQEIAGVDNQGYVGGSMRSGDITQRKTTRKIYVMEIAKGPGNIVPIAEEETVTDIIELREGTATDAAPLSVNPATATLKRFESYTVEKDDTLQKIAQKFYGSYHQWIRIYEANRSVIPNPDRIRPGTVLQVPLE